MMARVVSTHPTRSETAAQAVALEEDIAKLVAEGARRSERLEAKGKQCRLFMRALEARGALRIGATMVLSRARAQPKQDLAARTTRARRRPSRRTRAMSPTAEPGACG